MNELDSLKKEVKDLKDELVVLRNSVRRDSDDVWKLLSEICENLGVGNNGKNQFVLDFFCFVGFGFIVGFFWCEF